MILCGFDLNDDGFIDKDIGKEITDDDTVVKDFDGLLRLGQYPHLIKFVNERVFVDVFKKSNPSVFSTLKALPMIFSVNWFNSSSFIALSSSLDVVTDQKTEPLGHLGKMSFQFEISR